MKRSMQLIRRLRWYAVLVLLIGMTPMFGTVGGCPIGGVIFLPPPPPPEPPAPQPGSDPASNRPPTLRFDAPFANMTIQDGTAVQIRFTASDAEDQTRVNVFADFTDNSVDPPVEGSLVLATGRVFDAGGGSDTVQWNTFGIRPALYTIRATITDQINAPVTALAAGTVTLLPRPGEPPPDGEPPPAPNLGTTLRLVQPFGVAEIEQGDPLTIEWETTDFEDGALVTLTATLRTPDPNDTETTVVLVDNRREPPDPASPPGRIRDSFVWNRAEAPVDVGRWQFALTATEDRPIGEKNADPSPINFTIEVIFQRVGTENTSPTIITLLPNRDRGVSDGDIVGISCNYTNFEQDQDLNFTLILDNDNNPNNDDPSDPNDPSIIVLLERKISPLVDDLDGDGFVEPNEIDRIDSGGGVRGFPFDGLVDTYAPAAVFPNYINGNIPFIFDLDEDFVTDWVGAYTFMWRVDTGRVPPLIGADGGILPYFIRVDVTDGQVRRTSYAVGRIVPLAPVAAGTLVDLTEAGTRFSGARFQGFFQDDHLGSAFLRLGDQLVSDPFAPPADEVLIGARYGQPRDRGNVGSSFYLLGRPSTPDTGRFAGTLVMSGTGAESLGFTFGSARSTGIGSRDPDAARAPRDRGLWDDAFLSAKDRGYSPDIMSSKSLGITSMAQLPDITGDGLPEMVFGAPYIAGLYDGHDPDPCDCDSEPPGCIDPGCPIGTYIDFPPMGPSFPTSFSDTDGPCLADDIGDTNLDTNDSIDQGYVFLSSDYLNVGNATGFIDLKWVGQQGDSTVTRDDEGVTLGVLTQRSGGCRFRGGYFGFFPQDLIDPPFLGLPGDIRQTAPGGNSPKIDPQNEFGRTVDVIPNFHNSTTGLPDLIVSAPGTDISDGMNRPGTNSDEGRIYVMIGTNWVQTSDGTGGGAAGPGDDGTGNVSWPGFRAGNCDCTNCMLNRPLSYPELVTIEGAVPGGRLGYAHAAGDVNADFRPDLVCGAPFGPDTDGGLSEAGRVFVVYQPVAGLGNIMLGSDAPDAGVPRLELSGTSAGDHFGLVQSRCGDINGDGLVDMIFASSDYDDGALPDAGFVGIVFARPELQGTPRLVLNVNQVGTVNLQGIKFIGMPGSMAGASATGAGDFDGDGFDDFLVAAPNEERFVSGALHRGVVYLIFGGPSIANRTLRPNGSGVVDDLGNNVPAIILVSPFETGSIDEAPLETVAGVGDVDGDGFDDIMIGVPRANFVDPIDGTQRQLRTGQAYLVYGSRAGR